MKVCPLHQSALVACETRWGKRWQCPCAGCDVACWSGSTATPADALTRRARKLCHARFDPLWIKGENSPFLGKPGGKRARRTRAYAWLSKAMNLPQDQTHFGYFTIEQCRAAWLAMNTLKGKGGAR